MLVFTKLVARLVCAHHSVYLTSALAFEGLWLTLIFIFI